MDPTLRLSLLAAAAGGIDLTNILVGLLSGAAVVGAAFVTSRVAKRAQRDTALLEWARQLQASEQAARKEARESDDRAERIRDEADADVARLRTQVGELEARLEQATMAATRLTDTMTSVQSEVWRPEPDIGALRRLVGRPSAPTVNGRGV